MSTSRSENMLPETTGQLRMWLIVLGHAGGAGEPVLVAVDDLNAGSGDGGNGDDVGNVLQDGLGVVGGECFIGAIAHAHAAGIHAAGENHDHVVAERLNLLLHLRAGSLADGYRADHRAHADDDAEHGEDRPQLVAGQRPQRDADDLSGFMSRPQLRNV